MLPAGPRLDFLQAFWQTFRKFFEGVERDTQNNKLSINKRLVEWIKSGNGPKMIQSFNSQMKANFNYGFRRYNIESVENFRMIEYSEWNYIPFYRPAQAFRSIPVNEIHKMYYQFKNN